MEQGLTTGQKLAAARQKVRSRSPYYRAALYRVRWRADENIPTMGMTKGGIVYYSPAFVAQVSTEELAAAVVHELYHWIRDHHGRGKALGCDQVVWNVAGDLEINDDLGDQGYTLPADCLHPNKFGFPTGKLMEEYYNLLRKEAEKRSGGGADGEKGVMKGQCGGCAGNPGENEPSDGEAGGGKAPGEGVSGASGDRGLTEAEANRLRKEVAEDVRSLASKEATRGRGTVPQSWLRWADAQLAPARVNWRQKLAQLVKQAATYRPGAVATHYTQPSRRQAGVGFGAGRPILSAWRQPRPRVTVAVDTSGSMGTAEMKVAMEELDGILKATNAEVGFISCDSAVHENKSVQSWRDASLLLKGGGGTDFNPIFEAVAHPRGGSPRPEVLVLVTDGCGPAPAAPPAGVRVIWLLVSRYRRRPCEWGEVVEVDDGGE